MYWLVQEAATWLQVALQPQAIQQKPHVAATHLIADVLTWNMRCIKFDLKTLVFWLAFCQPSVFPSRSLFHIWLYPNRTLCPCVCLLSCLSQFCFVVGSLEIDWYCLHRICILFTTDTCCNRRSISSPLSLCCWLSLLLLSSVSKSPAPCYWNGPAGGAYIFQPFGKR